MKRIVMGAVGAVFSLMLVAFTTVGGVAQNITPSNIENVQTSSANSANDIRLFIVANEPDGYGIDRCLANSLPCGQRAAHAYCKARNYANVLAYTRFVEQDELVKVASVLSCPNGQCANYIAITCAN